MGNVSKWTMLCGSQNYSPLGQEPGILFVYQDLWYCIARFLQLTFKQKV